MFIRSPGGFQSEDVAPAASSIDSGRYSRNSSGDRSTWFRSGEIFLRSSSWSKDIFSFGLRSFARKSSSMLGFLYPAIVSFSSMTVWVKLGWKDSSRMRSGPFSFDVR